MISVHIYPSHFCYESRILKQTKAILEAGLASKVIIIASGRPDLPATEQIDPNREVIRLSMLLHTPKTIVSKLFSKLEFIIRAILFLAKSRPKWIHCHSCEMLVPGIMSKIFNRSILIYDTHELETERTGLTGLFKHLLKGLEQISFKFIDYTFVVSDSIGNWYLQKYPKANVAVVKNIPECPQTITPILRSKLGLKPQDKVFLYQGVLGPYRGIELLLAAWEKVDSDCHLVFIGYGEFENLIRKRLNPNIHLLEAVPPNELLSYTSDADVGLSIIEDASLSYSFCLPNKLFEYITAGCPVIISNRPEMVRFISHYGCGWIASEDPNELADLVSSLDSQEIASKSLGTKKAKEENTWEAESIRYTLKLAEVSNK